MNNLHNLAPSTPRVEIKRVTHIALTDSPPDPNCRIHTIFILKPRGFLSRLCYAPTYYWKARKLRLFRKRALRATLLYIKGT